MKSVIIYYSLDGNTRLIAKTIAQETNGDLLELKPKKELSSSSSKLNKYFWGGKSILFKEKPMLLNQDIILDKYDTIFIGTPIWVGTYSTAFNTFIEQHSISNKNIALFACHGGGGVSKCFLNFKKAFPNNRFIGEIDFFDPLRNHTEENILKLKEWISSLDI